MPDAEDALNNFRRKVADERCKARWLKVAGHAIGWAGPAILVTGLIEGFALAPPEVFYSPLPGYPCRIAAALWNLMDANAITSPVWWFLRLISPYPTLTWPLTPLSFLLSSVGLLGWSFGLLWLGIK